MSGTSVNRRKSTRNVFPCLFHDNIVVFGRAAIRESAALSRSIVTANRSRGRRAMISFTERFCALVSASSANDGVKTLIIQDAIKPAAGQDAVGEIVCAGLPHSS